MVLPRAALSSRCHSRSEPAGWPPVAAGAHTNNWCLARLKASFHIIAEAAAAATLLASTGAGNSGGLGLHPGYIAQQVKLVILALSLMLLLLLLLQLLLLLVPLLLL